MGPTVECNNCDGAINRPYPISGNWFNPDQSGSGYIIDIQKGFVSGFYFGYEENGAPTWLSFVGPIEMIDNESDVLWRIETTLTKVTNGNAINEPYQEPTIEPTGDSLVIDFISKHNARIAVNNGPIQNLQPLVFGVGQYPEFDESDKALPEMDGLWTFVFKRNVPGFVIQEHLFFSDIFSIRKGPSYVEDGTKFVDYSITKYFPTPPFEGSIVGSILCSNPINPDSMQKEVICELNGLASIALGFDYSGIPMIIPLGDLGAFNFTAELIVPGDEENGFTLEAKRVNYLSVDDID